MRVTSPLKQREGLKTVQLRLNVVLIGRPADAKVETSKLPYDKARLDELRFKYSESFLFKRCGADGDEFLVAPCVRAWHFLVPLRFTTEMSLIKTSDADLVGAVENLKLSTAVYASGAKVGLGLALAPYTV